MEQAEVPSSYTNVQAGNSTLIVRGAPLLTVYNREGGKQPDVDKKRRAHLQLRDPQHSDSAFMRYNKGKSVLDVG